MKKKDRGLLIALSVIIGIVISCAIIPLGGFALMLATFDSGTVEGGPLPARNWQEQVVEGKGTSRIVIIKVSGFIGAEEGASVFSNQVSHSQLLSQIRQATEDPLVKAMVLDVDTPGGGVVASREIYNTLQEFRNEDKPLIVTMGSVAASGGYYVSAPADKIYAYPDTLTGSLGVIISSINYTEAFDKLGLRQMVYKSGKYKDILSPAREPTPAEEEILNQFVDQAYQGFVDVIVEGRELPRETVLDLADGRIYSGQQALELKLVDEMGGRDEAITAAKELANLSEALVVRYRASSSLSDILLTYLQQPQPTATDPFGVHQVLYEQVPRLEYRMTP